MKELKAKRIAKTATKQHRVIVDSLRTGMVRQGSHRDLLTLKPTNVIIHDALKAGKVSMIRKVNQHIAVYGFEHGNDKVTFRANSI